MYTVEEIEALIDLGRPGEGLAEIESRFGHAWLAQQQEDGVSREEIARQVLAVVDGAANCDKSQNTIAVK